MGDLMSDIAMLNRTRAAETSNKAPATPTRTPKNELDMTDFLTLMVTELTNQSMDSTADTSDMLNQLVQMQMVQVMTNMVDASIMSYAASLVGKEVTVAQYNSDGSINEIVGVVTGTGTMNGEQVVFVGDKYYHMNEIIAVGRLPEKEDPIDPEFSQPDPSQPDSNKPADPNKPDPNKPADPNKPDPNKPANPNKPVDPNKPANPADKPKPPAETEKPTEGKTQVPTDRNEPTPAHVLAESLEGNKEVDRRVAAMEEAAKSQV